MASPNAWPGGLNLAGTVFAGGGTVAALTSDSFSGAIQFLDTIGGNNANLGTSPEFPVQTIAQAITNSAANGVILIGAGSAETLLVSQALSLAGLHIIGCGTGTSRPRYTCSGAGIVMLSAAAAGVIIENLYFPASSGAGSNRVSFTAASGEIRDCYFECGASDTTQALLVDTGGSNTLIRGCTFAVTASRPSLGLGIIGAVSDVSVEDCVFDGGAFGWGTDTFRPSATQTRLKIRNVSMIRRSDFNLTATGSSYKAFGLTFDGTSREVFAA